MGRVYVSSTFSDLVDHREQAIQTILKCGFDVSAMEYYPSTTDMPLRYCWDDLSRCDIYLGIFAFRYGYIPPGEQRSITELEYIRAREASKPCMIFIANLTNSRPQSFDLADISRFRSELQTNHVVNFFDTPDDLVKMIAHSLAQHLQLWPKQQLQEQVDGARSLMRSGAFAEAGRHLAELAAANPKSAEVSHLLSICLFGGRSPRFATLGIVRKAEEYANLAAILAPADGRHDFLLGSIRKEYYQTHCLRVPSPSPEVLIERARTKGLKQSDAAAVRALLGLD